MGTLGRYQLEKKLAVGGMAEVWLARSEGPGNFSKRVVVKRLLPNLLADARFTEMFLHEAALVAQLDHPHIVQLFDFGEEGGVPYLALEYMDGPSLASVRKHARATGAPLPLALCARVVADACEGLAHAHDFRHPRTGEPLGLVHRDVSPDNLLLSRAGAVKVADFGIARSGMQQHRTKTGVLKGKLPYVTPEQLHGKPLDRRVDVYALGVVLYELLALERPFSAKGPAQLMRQILFDSPPPLHRHREDVPEALESIARRALEKDRERRFADCSEMQRALETWLAEARQPFGSRELAVWLSGWYSAEQAPAAEVVDKTQSDGGPTTDRAVTRDDRPLVTAEMAPASRPVEERGPPQRVADDEDTLRQRPVSRQAPENTGETPLHVPPGGRTAQGGAGGEEKTEQVWSPRKGASARMAVTDPGDDAETGDLATTQPRRMFPGRRAPRLVGAAAGAGIFAVAAWAWLGRSGVQAPPVAVQVEEAVVVGVLDAGRPPGSEAPPSEASAAEPARSSPPGRLSPAVSPARAGTPAAVFEQGSEALRRNQLDSAAAQFRRCLDLDPGHAPCWRGLGLTYTRMGRADDGAVAYRRFLELAPDDPRAPAARLLLEEYERGRAGR